MKNILRIDSSLFPAESISNQLMDELISQMELKLGPLNIVQHNLAVENIPHLDADWITSIRTNAHQRNSDQKRKAMYSNNFISELQKADLLILGIPMYNFGVSSAMKAWFDHIAQAGVTFRYRSNRSEGLLTNKKAIIVTTRGGFHKNKTTDTLIPFVKNFLKFIGITDIEIIFAEGINMSGDHREKSLAEAREHIANLIAA